MMNQSISSFGAICSIKAVKFLILGNSISIPTALFAPSFNAAMAKMPEPQPKSMTVLSFKSRPSSHSKHSAVVG